MKRDVRDVLETFGRTQQKCGFLRGFGKLPGGDAFGDSPRAVLVGGPEERVDEAWGSFFVPGRDPPVQPQTCSVGGPGPPDRATECR